MRILAKDTHPRLRASDLGQDVFRGFVVNLYDGCGQWQVDSLTDIRTLNEPFSSDLLGVQSISKPGRFRQFGEVKNMYYRKLVSVILATAMMVGVVGLVSGKSTDANKTQHNLESVEPLNLAILIQDDLVSQVGNELEVTRTFIRSMPRGSRVMVGYITSGTLQVRQPFTTDLDKAAKSLRIPTSVLAVHRIILMWKSLKP